MLDSYAKNVNTTVILTLLRSMSFTNNTCNIIQFILYKLHIIISLYPHLPWLLILIFHFLIRLFCVCSGVGAVQDVCEEEASFWCGYRWLECGKYQQGQKPTVGDGNKNHGCTSVEHVILQRDEIILIRIWEKFYLSYSEVSESSLYWQTHSFYSLDFSNFFPQVHVCVQLGGFFAGFIMN